MHGRWVKLHQDILEHDVWSDDWTLKLWIWCLLKANFKPRRFKGTKVQRGQFITGQRSAAEELGVSASKWYRGMMRLAEYGSISIEANRDFSVVTVCKYESYQATKNGKRIASESQVNRERITSESQVNTREEDLIPLSQEGKKERNRAADAAADSSDLRSWLVWWNELHAEHLVPHAVKVDPPSQAVQNAFSRGQKSREVRTCLSDRESVSAAIRASDFCRKSWFRLETLLGGKNKDGQWIAVKLTEGGYQSRNDDPRGNLALRERLLAERKAERALPMFDDVEVPEVE